MPSVVKFLFGSGWFMLWHGAIWVGGFLFVVLPLWMLSRELIPKPCGPASLGSVAFIIWIALCLAAATLVSAVLAGNGGGLGWLATTAIAIVGAGAVLCGTYAMLARFCDVGGYGWFWTIWSTVAALFVANLAMSGWGR